MVNLELKGAEGLLCVRNLEVKLDEGDARLRVDSEQFLLNDLGFGDILDHEHQSCKSETQELTSIRPSYRICPSHNQHNPIAISVQKIMLSRDHLACHLFGHFIHIVSNGDSAHKTRQQECL